MEILWLIGLIMLITPIAICVEHFANKREIGKAIFILLSGIIGLILAQVFSPIERSVTNIPQYEPITFTVYKKK
jgi:uncharacterized membrane protein HdeD (DUF308 family)